MWQQSVGYIYSIWMKDCNNNTEEVCGARLSVSAVFYNQGNNAVYHPHYVSPCPVVLQQIHRGIMDGLFFLAVLGTNIMDRPILHNSHNLGKCLWPTRSPMTLS